MADSFTETTTTSWGKRITDSFGGMLVGLACFIGAFVLLWWGEGRSIDRIRTLDEGRGIVVSVSSADIDTAHDGALVHFSGKAISGENLSDPEFGIFDEGLLKLRRVVEMYQWKEDKSTETKEEMGGSETTKTTYSYKKTWSDALIDSQDFKHPEEHANPATMPFEKKEQVAANIHVGAFELTEAFTDQISNYEPYPLSKKQFEGMEKDLQTALKLHGNEYDSGDPAAPKIGDVRVHFEMIKPEIVSVVGKQDDGKVKRFSTKRGSIELLALGDEDAESMFAQAESENKVLTWLLRLGGILLMWGGLALLLRPIRMLGAVVPFIGALMGAGIGLVSAVVSLVLGTITIAVAWLFYRPMIGGIVLLLALGVLLGGYRLIKDKITRRANA